MYIGAIDQGTTSTRFILFSYNGTIISSSQKEHKQIYPKPGWCEHDPLEIYENVIQVIQNTLNKCPNIHKNDIKSIGITNQRETIVIWDKIAGLPLYNAIVWHDKRTNDMITKQIHTFNNNKNYFKSITGLPINTYFSSSKLIWLLDNIPNIRNKCNNNQVLVGTIDSWLIWKLTYNNRTKNGIHITDVTNASRTNLMSLIDQKWDQNILKLLNIPIHILPKILSSSEIYGICSKDTPLENVIISGNLGDQQAALFGQTCFNIGDCKNTYGTGCFMMVNTGNKPIYSNKGLLTTIAYKIGKEETMYALEGSIAVAGSLIQWLRDNLNLISSSSDIEDYAKQVDNNGGVYIVPAFSGLFAPHWRNDARGIICGLTGYANKYHIARAALESTCFQTEEVIKVIQEECNIHLTDLKVDGGMVINNILMQSQADISNLNIIKPKIKEITALGAAYAAGLAVGFWKSKEELKLNWKIEKTWTPNMDNIKRLHMVKMWNKAVERTLNWEEEEEEKNIS